MSEIATRFHENWLGLLRARSDGLAATPHRAAPRDGHRVEVARRRARGRAALSVPPRGVGAPPCPRHRWRVRTPASVTDDRAAVRWLAAPAATEHDLLAVLASVHRRLGRVDDNDEVNPALAGCAQLSLGAVLWGLLESPRTAPADPGRAWLLECVPAHAGAAVRPDRSAPVPQHGLAVRHRRAVTTGAQGPHRMGQALGEGVCHRRCRLPTMRWGAAHRRRGHRRRRDRLPAPRCQAATSYAAWAALLLRPVKLQPRGPRQARSGGRVRCRTRPALRGAGGSSKRPARDDAGPPAPRDPRDPRPSAGSARSHHWMVCEKWPEIVRVTDGSSGHANSSS